MQKIFSPRLAPAHLPPTVDGDVKPLAQQHVKRGAGSLGGLVFLYLPETPLHHRMVSLMACAFAMTACYALGVMSHLLPAIMMVVLPAPVLSSLSNLLQILKDVQTHLRLPEAGSSKT